MKCSLPESALYEYVHRLLSHILPDGYAADPECKRYFSLAMDRVQYCFSRIRRKYYLEQGETVFDHLNADHMAKLLYFYANTVWKESGESGLATRLSYLNKCLHGLDLFYSVGMPDIFLLVHPVGTVLGNARYQDYLVVYQNCTVGAVTNVYPTFGEGTILYSRASVLGNCRLGNDVVVAANALLLDTEVPSVTTVVGQYPAHRFLQNAVSVRERCFDAPSPGVPH